jgi:hypothetical protein
MGRLFDGAEARDSDQGFELEVRAGSTVITECYESWAKKNCGPVPGISNDHCQGVAELIHAVTKLVSIPSQGSDLEGLECLEVILHGDRGELALPESYESKKENDDLSSTVSTPATGVFSSFTFNMDRVPRYNRD